jgi:hypothetical protein
MRSLRIGGRVRDDPWLAIVCRLLEQERPAQLFDVRGGRVAAIVRDEQRAADLLGREWIANP